MVQFIAVTDKPLLWYLSYNIFTRGAKGLVQYGRDHQKKAAGSYFDTQAKARREPRTRGIQRTTHLSVHDRRRPLRSHGGVTCPTTDKTWHSRTNEQRGN